MTSPAPSWLRTPTHLDWLDEHARSLLGFGVGVVSPDGGAGWLTDDGSLDPGRGVHTWITCRMAHVYGLGSLLGVPGSRPLAQAALDALRGRLHDDAHGGWYASVAADGAVDTTKSGYAHAFVVLAASTGVVAGLEGAQELLDDALEVLDTRFFDAATGLHVDEWDESWTVLDPYRGVNGNMHAVEALLAAADVTGDARWRERALGIAHHVGVEWAPANGWRIPEHFDESWTPQPDLNEDTPDDPFKPYGATVGHGIEWSRLLLNLWAGLGDDAPGWLVPAAEELYRRAVADGWRESTPGAHGFVYTTGWDGEPVVATRMHWVAAEAVGAAASLAKATGDSRYDADYSRWWDHVAEVFLDHEHGSWHHELDATNTPTAKVWPGKPDIYHAFQATLFPQLPLAPSLSVALRDGLLRS